MVNRNDRKQRNVRVIEQQLNQSKNPFITKTLLVIKSHHSALKPSTSFMLSKRKNLVHEKLTEPCTRPSRMPGRNNICFTTTPCSCPPLLLQQKIITWKQLIKHLRWRFEKRKLTFFRTWHEGKFLRRHIPVPHLYLSERRYLLLGPMIWGTRPQPA